VSLDELQNGNGLLLWRDSLFFPTQLRKLGILSDGFDESLGNSQTPQKAGEAEKETQMPVLSGW
ncbi:MAG: hypothetical protein KDA84_02345, partial [Planctomycetaceae bacterium]|nr:hypothetical protein [Planctomycetaceae bacterium]